jgi:hypothetical protein
MAVSGVNSPGSWSWVYNQQVPATSKAEALSDNAVATQEVQEANQVATELQASTRGDSQSIDKLA